VAEVPKDVWGVGEKSGGLGEVCKEEKTPKNTKDGSSDNKNGMVTVKKYLVETFVKTSKHRSKG